MSTEAYYRIETNSETDARAALALARKHDPEALASPDGLAVRFSVDRGHLCDGDWNPLKGTSAIVAESYEDTPVRILRCDTMSQLRARVAGEAGETAILEATLGEGWKPVGPATLALPGWSKLQDTPAPEIGI